VVTRASSQKIYVVEDGDTLSDIAIRHGITLAELRAANPETLSGKNKKDIKVESGRVLRRADLIYIGQELVLPENAALVQEVALPGPSIPAPLTPAGSAEVPLAGKVALGVLLLAAAAKGMQMAFFAGKTEETSDEPRALPPETTATLAELTAEPAPVAVMSDAKEAAKDEEEEAKKEQPAIAEFVGLSLGTEAPEGEKALSSQDENVARAIHLANSVEELSMAEEDGCADTPHAEHDAATGKEAEEEGKVEGAEVKAEEAAKDVGDSTEGAPGFVGGVMAKLGLVTPYTFPLAPSTDVTAAFPSVSHLA